MDQTQFANLLLAHDRDLQDILALFPKLKEQYDKKIAASLAELSEAERKNLGDALKNSVELAKTSLEERHAELAGNLRDFARTTLDLAANELGTTIAGRFSELADGVRALAAEREKLLAAKLAEVPAIESRLVSRVSEEAHAIGAAVKAELANQLSKQVETKFAELPPPAVIEATKASFLDWFKGNWNKETAYKAGDIFSFRGSCYIVYLPVRGAMPTQQLQKGPNPTYGIIAAAGAPGQNGVGGGGGSSLPDQSGNAGKFLTTDGSVASWATLAGGGDLLAANNLSDVASAATSFANIKQAATTAASGVVTLATDGGTTAGTVVQATDGRLSDARTPTAHAASHAAAGSDPLTLSPSQVGLGNVTNNAQTQAAIVPNTAPAAGQVLVGNAGGTAYAPQSVSGDGTISSAGALSVTKTGGVNFAASATTDTTDASNISAGTLAASRGGAGTVNGILKANGSGTVSAATSGTDYAAAGAVGSTGITMTTARLLGRTTASTGAVEEITVGSGLSLSAGTLTATGGGGWTSGVLFRNNASTEIINNSTTETSCFPGASSKAIPGGTLGTAGVIRFCVAGQLTNNTGANQTLTLKILYGGTAYYQDATPNIGSNANPRGFRIEGELCADDSTSAQRLAAQMTISAAGTVTTGYGDLGSASGVISGNQFGGTPTQDSTADKDFDVTLTASSASASYTVRVHAAYVTKV